MHISYPVKDYGVVLHLKLYTGLFQFYLVAIKKIKAVR